MRHALAVALLLISLTPPLRAQTQLSPDTAFQHGHPLFTSGDALLAGGLAVTTVSLFGADRYVARHLRDQGSPANTTLDRAGRGVEILTSPGAFIIGPALYLGARATHQPEVADLALHGTEAALLGSTLITVLKGVAGRARPYASSDTMSNDFKLGGGFSGSRRQSFPSGHTTTAFAVASSVTSEVHRIWPRATWVVGPLLYAGATGVGLSRMYHNQHWASDVVAGAAVGIFAGLKTVRYSHAHPNNFIDRHLLPSSLSPDGAHQGVTLRWSFPVEIR